MQLIKYIFILFFCQTLLSQEFHDTQGKLDITNSGQATFTLPIALPPSIQSVGPTINLLYVSGQSGGIAGQGWSINSISSITRIATRLDIDGFIDGVDFDDNDKLALDGQRLLLKSGTYWGDGSIYETEIQSNTKVQLMGSGVSMYFIVTSPDGSRAWYGNYNWFLGFDLNSYYITRFEDANGNRITYYYNNSSPNNNLVHYSSNTITIKEIQFSSNLNDNNTLINKIKFSYGIDSYSTNAYLKGTIVKKIDILKKIEVFTDNQLFRKYDLYHTTDNFGYKRINKIIESNGVGEEANPIIFEYDSTQSGLKNDDAYDNRTFADNKDMNNGIKFTGDFNGDGRLDIVFENTLYMKSKVEEDYYQIQLPFNASSRLTMVASTIFNNKLTQQQSLINVNENLSTLQFNILNVTPSSTNTASYQKNFNFDNSRTTYEPNLNLTTWGGVQENPSQSTLCEHPVPSIGNTNQYLEGDFNGDGISELLILKTINHYYFKKTIYINPGQIMVEQCETKYSNDGIEVFILDTNPSSSTILGEKGYVKITNLTNMSDDDKKYIQDFNGDGKADLLVVKRDHSYRVISFKQLLVSPWIEAEIIGQGTFYFSFHDDKQYLFGDFNGDGKTDIMHPNVTGVGCEDHNYCNTWYIYYSNPKLDNGDFFEITNQQITSYMPRRDYSQSSHTNLYYAIDVNKDGKSDLVRFELQDVYSATFHHWNESWRVRTYINNIGNLNSTSNFVYDLESPFVDEYTGGNSIIPFFGSLKLNKNSTSSDFMIFCHKPWDNGGCTLNPCFFKFTKYYSFKKNFIKDNSIIKIKQSAESIINEIEYNTISCSDSNNGNGLNTDYYSISNTSLYPYMEIRNVPLMRVVSKLTNTTSGYGIRFQDFKYRSLTTNLNGLGAIGFGKTVRSNWYTSNSLKKIWEVSENNPLKRGILEKFYSRILDSNVPISLENTITGPSAIQGYINFTEYNYTSPIIDSISKRYTLLLDKQKSTDLLTNVINETSYHYTTDGYFLPDIVTSKNYEDVKLQSTKITETSFDSSITGVGNSYYIGRPTSSNTTITAYDDTKTSSEKFYYNNGNVIKTQKTKGNDPVVMVEDMTYFPDGNLKDKTISATGTTGVDNVSPRKTSYTYDSSNRYVKTTITPDGIETINNGFDELYGLVKSQTNTTFNQTISNEYDAWGKTTAVTDYLGKSITYSYERNGDEYITKVYPESGGESFTVSDALARVIRKGHLDLSGRMVLQDTKYDELGRKSEESEPYFEGDEPDQWSYFTYDDLSRIIQLNEFTGKITTYEYDGLIVKTDDRVLKKEIAKNANGDLMSSTETPGGIIRYEYDAEGKLLKSIYDETEMTIIYDAWGRKIEMNDPSGGIYKYKYNPYGELLEEETLKGYTRNRYDAIGKLLTKQVIGKTVEDRTNIFNVYTYDPIYKWLTKIDVTNEFDGNSVYEYSYDIGSGSTETKQLKKTVETIFNPQQTYTKELTFDDFGRVSTEASTVAAYGKSSSKTVFNKYKLNELFQIRDTNEQGALLWEAIKFNARGQLTNSNLGNNITISNTFDEYGHPVTFTHSLQNQYPFMNLQTAFNPQFGSLWFRTNSLFNTIENYEYDNSQRLIGWSNDFKTYQNCKFTSGIENFTSIGGTLTNVNGKLNASLEYANGVTKKIVNDGLIGEILSVKFESYITNPNCGNIGNYALCNNSILHVKIYEKDPLTNTISNSVDYVIYDGQFNKNYTITDNGNVYLEFYGVPINSNNGVVIHFNLDNLLVNTYKEFTQDYSDSGKITKNELGEYRYTNPEHPYQNNTIKLTDEALSYYTPIGRQDIKYNAFKCPISIAQANERIDFGYNGMQQRNTMYYGSTAINPIDRPNRKHYSADGTMEIKYTKPNGSIPEQVEFIIYIGGDAYSAPILVKNDENYYLHRDYLGSILAITNNEGAIVEKRQFDAWGNIVKVEDGAGTTLEKLTFIDRGYTGHEHLQDVGLINMNARLYDPKLHRLLQADNFIQDPTSTQDYNRYSYAHNNPLKYIDPDGNNPIILIGIGVSLVSYFAVTHFNHQKITIDGITNAIFWGFMSSAASFGVGEFTSTITTLTTRIAVQSVLHGATQGGFASLQGGKFWNSFASGSVSSLAASGWSGGSNLNVDGEEILGTGFSGFGGSSGASMIAFGTVMGGVGAKLSGGNFWQGAVTGLFVSGFNHYAHISGERRSLLARFKKGGVDPFAKPDFSEKGMQTLNNDVDGLHGAYSEGASPKFKFNLSGKDLAMTEDGIVNLNQSKLQTNYRLASTLFHEYRHAWMQLRVGGNPSIRDNYYKKYGPEMGHALGERKAYEYQIQMGGGDLPEVYEWHPYYANITKNIK